MTVTILTGDCREVMRALPPGSVDLVVTDPPYVETTLAWDRDAAGWLEALRPLLAPHASVWCFGSLRFFMERAGELASWPICQEVVWEKHNGSGPVGAGRFNRVHELVVQLRPPGARWAEITKSNPITFDATARKVKSRAGPAQRGTYAPVGYETVDGGPRRARSVMPVRSMHHNAMHPTEKPIDLLKQFISASSLPGHTILDPFAGSGSTGEATHALGRNAILIEKSRHFSEVARQRLLGIQAAA